MKNIVSKDQETIIAQCTPHGSGAIALLRLSGDNALSIADALCTLASGKKILELSSHTVHYGSVRDQDGVIIDRVMVIVMHAPKTFTGQHTVEITCHNNQFLIEAIIARAIACGARLADNGEFSRRAVINNKIDVIQAEAINELIHASHQLSLKQSLSQLDGSFSRWIITIEKRLIKCLALSEASFEFLDEENMQFGQQIKDALTTTLSDIAHIKKTFDQQQQIRDGVRVALLGSVNAGKSSLFNALLNKERAIVTNIAGTTRDVIEAGMYVDGTYWTLVDTAGLRHTDDIVEKKGIERSRQEAEKADIIILVYDASCALTEQEQQVYDDIMHTFGSKIIVVHNKVDIAATTPVHPERAIASRMDHPALCPIRTSVQDQASIIQLHSVLDQKIKTLFEGIASPFLLNKRQFHLLTNLEQNIHTILPMLDGSIAYELLSCHLQDAIVNISELTGKSISEAGMDAVFKEFCIGK